MANSEIHSTFFLGATTHLTNKAIIKITGKNDEPIWTEQWPLMKDKLQAAKELRHTIKIEILRNLALLQNLPFLL